MEDIHEHHNETNEYITNDPTNLVDWICERCDHKSSSKCNLLKHLRNVTPCNTTHSTITREDYIAKLIHKDYNEKTYDCQYCQKKFNKYQNRHRHLKTCKTLKEQNESSDLKLRKAMAENISLKKIVEDLNAKVNELQQQPSNSVTHHVTTKKKKKKLSYVTRVSCWNKYVGVTVGETQCLCCKFNTITQMNWECGHIVAESCGGSNDIENLRPICRHCNNDMGSENMREFALRHFHTEIE